MSTAIYVISAVDYESFGGTLQYPLVAFADRQQAEHEARRLSIKLLGREELADYVVAPEDLFASYGDLSRATDILSHYDYSGGDVRSFEVALRHASDHELAEVCSLLSVEFYKVSEIELQD